MYLLKFYLTVLFVHFQISSKMAVDNVLDQARKEEAVIDLDLVAEVKNVHKSSSISRQFTVNTLHIISSRILR